LAFGRDVFYVSPMTRSSSWVERPILRLLLLALMGLALASRLALGATLPMAGATDGANAADPLAKLQAAMIMCHPGHDPAPPPALPRGPLLSDLLLFDQADNAHALTSNPVPVLPFAWCWSAVAFLPVHTASRPPLWRSVTQARGPPAIV
jgi:hypothetical protein